MNTKLTPENIRPILAAAAAVSEKSIYSNAVFKYADSLLDYWQEQIDYPNQTEDERAEWLPTSFWKINKLLMNGAGDWLHYSQGASHAAITTAYEIMIALYGKEYADSLSNAFFYTDTANKQEARALEKAASMIINAAAILEHSGR